MVVPAGWYDDGSGRQRWWDGAAWTEHTVATEASTTTAPSDAPHHRAEHERADDERAEDQRVKDASAARASGDPAFEPPYAWQSGSPFAGAPGGTPQYGRTWTPETSADAFDPRQDATAGYGSYGAVSPRGATTLSVLGMIGLGVAVLGVVLACIPPISVAGWVLLGAGFVLSLISLFLRGAKWPGAVGMVVAVLGGIVAVAVVLLTLGSAGLTATAPTAAATPEASQSTDPDDTAAAPEGSAGADGAETVTVNELAVGHCLPLMEWEEEVYELPIVPCDTPHTDEVYFIFDAPDGEFPGDDGLQTIAADRCDAAFEEFIGVPYADSELDNYWFVPTESSWKRLNDRAIQCIVISYDEITGTLEGADR
ncbi:DUF2510 domain-containing protein [Microbacterium sp. NPDC089320]|uniref:DUF2510 domain-containing protein n=1 Tax=Microbacterium sp. NPDC089320 TaxID=3155182 RepID=UPI003435E4E5